jgi:hypothetical protein
MPPPDRISQTPQPQGSRPFQLHQARPASVMLNRIGGVPDSVGAGGRQRVTSIEGGSGRPVPPPFVQQLRDGLNGGAEPFQREY